MKIIHAHVQKYYLNKPLRNPRIIISELILIFEFQRVVIRSEFQLSLNNF